MSTYNDLFMRDSLIDTGTIPSPYANVCLSPDIIPVGTTPLSDPKKLITSEWGQNVGVDLKEGYFNYIYARGENLAPGAAEGDVYLYYSPSSILLNPEKWRGNVIPASSKSQPKFIASLHGEKVLANNTFCWRAPEQPRGWHYCLISRIVTKEHPNPIPEKMSGSGAFTKWVRENPGVAWRNVYIQTPSEEPSYTHMYDFSSLDDHAEDYAILVKCENFPAGTVVNVACGSSEPQPPINTSEELNGEKSEYVYTETNLPAKFEGHLIVTITLPDGAAWPKGARVTVSCLKRVGGDDLDDIQIENHKQLAMFAEPREAFNLTSEHTTAEQLVLLGDAEIIFAQ